MQFQRLGEAGQEIPVVIYDGVAKDLRPLTSDITPDFIATTTASFVESQAKGLPELPGADSLRIGAPISNPGAVYCIGMNYAKHAAEGGAEPPKDVVMFFKPPHTLAGPNDDVLLPPGFTKVDWEVELAVIVGKIAWQLTPQDNPLDYIFGFALANDLSDRHWQLEISGGQWSKGKSAPGFLPLGPSIVPTSEMSANSLQLRSWVNGEPRQDSNTGDMIFSVEQIIRDLSQFTVLKPGDIILTGTPEGVALSGRFPYLDAGDEVSMSIDGLGLQTQLVFRQN
jgi:2,4-didehydro-3-deoxy-L-rhamnonate hydrolase